MDQPVALANAIAEEHAERELTPWEVARRDAADSHDKTCIAALNALVAPRAQLLGSFRWADVLEGLRKQYNLAIIPVPDWRVATRDAVSTRIYSQGLAHIDHLQARLDERDAELARVKAELVEARSHINSGK